MNPLRDEEGMYRRREKGTTSDHGLKIRWKVSVRKAKIKIVNNVTSRKTHVGLHDDGVGPPHEGSFHTRHHDR